MKKYNASKYKKYRLLKEDGEMIPFLPETTKFTKKKFIEMLEKYNTIIVKPSTTDKGFNVMKVTKQMEQYILLTPNTQETFTDVHLLFTKIKESTKSQAFIVQSYIPLAVINGNIFDMRVMVQRKKDADWNVTGLYAKVARDGNIVTNLRTNATVMEVDKAIELSNIQTDKSIEDILTEINKVALKAVTILSKTLNKYHIWGIDMGIDHHGDVWIIEANTGNVGYRGFLQLDDKTLYNRIRSYIKNNKS